VSPVALRAAPSAGKGEGNFVFACFGDTRSNGEQDQGGVNRKALAQVVPHIAAARPALALFVGDPIVGAKDMASFLRQQALFADAMKPLAGIPVHFAFGNHESRNAEQVKWLREPRPPRVNPGNKARLLFDAGGCHFATVATHLPAREPARASSSPGSTGTCRPTPAPPTSSSSATRPPGPPGRTCTPPSTSTRPSATPSGRS
jgi:hypothetical protein